MSYPGIPRDAREVYLDERGEPMAYCPKESVGLTDLFRAEFYRLGSGRSQELLVRAEAKGARDHAVVCIDVDDPTWTWLVDALMPGHCWADYRQRGERPCARGIVPRGLLHDVITECYPVALPLPDVAFVAVFAAGGVSLFGKE